MNSIPLFVTPFVKALLVAQLDAKAWALVAMFFFGLLAALFGVGAAFQLSSDSPARRPSPGRITVICIVVALLFYPALFGALEFEFHVVAKGNPGAQAGVLALVIAMGVCTIVSMVATLVMMGRSR
jgi:hypothetical protein